MDTVPFWMATKLGWLRKMLQKDYLETKKSNNIHQQTNGRDINEDTETEDWLKMLIYELIKISGDISLTPIKLLTGWGTEKMRTYGLRLKNKFWKTIFTGIEKLEEGFYYTYPQYLGEMVIWNTQRIRTRGIQLQARGVNSIGYGESRDELGITTINQIIVPVPKPINEETKKSNIIKN